MALLLCLSEGRGGSARRARATDARGPHRHPSVSPSMGLTLAERSHLIAPSATLAMAGAARKLKSEGVDVLDFALGEPDFPTPENIQQAAIRAMRAGQTHYTPAAGIPELRQAVADHYTRHQGLPTKSE